MIRAFALAAALAVGATLPALADDTQATTTTAPAFQSIFTETQARQHLLHLGYSEVSPLEQDATGKWVGTASKDGKKVVVAVDVKRPAATATN